MSWTSQWIGIIPLLIGVLLPSSTLAADHKHNHAEPSNPLEVINHIESFFDLSTCNDFLKPAGKTQYWPPLENDTKIRFQGFNESCDADKEFELYHEIMEIAELKFTEAKLNNLLYSDEYYLRKFAQEYNKFLRNETQRKYICDPRWLLQCDNATNRCMCLNLTGPNRQLAREDVQKSYKEQCKNYRDTTCQVETTNGFRCVAHINSYCHYIMPAFGMCSMNCQLKYNCAEVSGEDVTTTLKTTRQDTYTKRIRKCELAVEYVDSEADKGSNGANPIYNHNQITSLLIIYLSLRILNFISF